MNDFQSNRLTVSEDYSEDAYECRAMHCNTVLTLKTTTFMHNIRGVVTNCLLEIKNKKWYH